MCKSIRATHETKQVPTDAAEELEKETTVEPPESDHPKCEDLVVANGRWSLTRIEPREVSLRRKPDTPTLTKRIYCGAISKLRYVQFHVDVVSTTRDHLQEFKNNAKSLNRQLQLVVAGACRRDSSWKT